MRGFLASSIGVACAAALSLPFALSYGAGAATTPSAARALTAEAIPGSTQSLPLSVLPRDRGLRAPGEQGLTQRDVRPFSLVGVVWNDPAAELEGRVQVRTRATGSARWSGWQEVETHNGDHAPDPGTAESDSGRLRGSTAPLWVGASDGIEVRVRPQAAPAHRGTAPAGSAANSAAQAPLPKGLRLELVDPGKEPPPGGAPADVPRAGAMTAESAAASAVNADLAPLGADVIPALGKKKTENELIESRGGEADAKSSPYIGPRPRIVTRKGWGADETLRESNFSYTSKVKAAFVHHSATGNNYSCSQAPSVIRGIYRYHVKSMGWRDIGYNFLVDKCGNIYEGRAGGVAKPVMGAHTLGFNTNSMGVAVIGTFESSKPPVAAVEGIARLTAWKLGLYGVNPSGKTYLTSAGGNLYGKGESVRLNVISGHRDGFATECPGRLLYNKLGTARSTSASLQGR
ncbi:MULTISPECIES: peptidoglycan recognition protein [unclassified Streptomyces]|uniref:peptidoglycan recognition protein family protein n=1 Tax=unclassified Streptomyces TaxID=2593676 RepID=UPI002252784F|nr:N-acetylmuramoyl-L-alanine amidase [Streptomyces sp. NBC_00401]MCX5082144.1 N-acetylmuramoyl-L-alanine amidase [Streptomyces sp. NBC_00401]